MERLLLPSGYSHRQGSLAIIQTVRRLTDVGPFPHADRGDGFRLCEEIDGKLKAFLESAVTNAASYTTQWDNIISGCHDLQISVLICVCEAMPLLFFRGHEESREKSHQPSISVCAIDYPSGPTFYNAPWEHTRPLV